MSQHSVFHCVATVPRASAAALVAYLCLWGAMTGSAQAQPDVAAPGEIRCVDCSATGQKPAAGRFDEAKVEFIATLDPFRMEPEADTNQLEIIARVLETSPLVIEILDSELRSFDRQMRVTGRDLLGGKDPATCGISQIDSIELKSKPVVSTLRFNDLIAGTMVVHRTPQSPTSILPGKFVLTGVRRISEPVPYFHSPAVIQRCANRSGRLVVYHGPRDGENLTIYNDGGIYQQTAASKEFSRERLSAEELSGLLAAFGEATFDAIPSAVPEILYGRPSTLRLIGARYQTVSTRGLESRLAPILERLAAAAAKASSHSQYILRTTWKTKLTVSPWPYAELSPEEIATVRNRAGDAWRQRVPDELMTQLPESIAINDSPEKDPNWLVHFSHGGKLYRVAKPFGCADFPAGCTFFALSAAEVRPPLPIECTPGSPRCQKVFIVDNPDEAAAGAQVKSREVYRSQDGHLPGSGRLWPPDVAVKLGDLPIEGATISADEYERHKDLYSELLKKRVWGMSFIENGFLYEKVRLCQVEPGTVDDCVIK